MADALDPSVEALYVFGFKDIIDYVTFNGAVPDSQVYSCNLQWFKGLPKKVQEGIEFASEVTMAQNLAKVPAARAFAMSELRKSGVKFYVPTADEMKQWVAKAGAQLPAWNDIKKELAGSLELFDSSRRRPTPRAVTSSTTSRPDAPTRRHRRQAVPPQTAVADREARMPHDRQNNPSRDRSKRRALSASAFVCADCDHHLCGSLSQVRPQLLFHLGRGSGPLRVHYVSWIGASAAIRERAHIRIDDSSLPERAVRAASS